MSFAGAVARFNDAAVRDLAWLLFSPDLLSASHAGAPLACPVESDKRAAVSGWLEALDDNPEALHALVRKPSLRRLGLYAEALLEYFLTHGPNARLIAANVPLRAAGQTLGEVDFLLHNARRERLHWELAVKFYLHIGEGAAALSDYVGPNLQDRFDLKHDRLLHHQLGLSARDEFASLGFEGPWRAELFVKGRLFYRQCAAPTLPPELADDHLRGWWMTVSEWQESKGDEAFAVVPRLAWLAERSLSNEEAGTLTFDAGALTSPTMVANYDRSAGDIWRERSRGFIVPDEWPERALRYARLTTT
ncbi:MAG: DUF1853 family protein [Pseudomonadota bacterium]|uniref:DUF1853 family protein n=1 Tax=Burkholderia sp. PAMC 26561 TaxID=1795043 RepID=UPI000A4940E4|nr:DUF1853 family protein [Burkholderia sp. PAMC 26561]MDP9154437.1 DUF1853 family protein [Pseudomonadota bacterium]